MYENRILIVVADIVLTELFFLGFFYLGYFFYLRANSRQSKPSVAQLWFL